VIEYGFGEAFLRPEMVSEGALRHTSLADDVAHARAVVAGLEHNFEAGGDDVFTMRVFGHEA